MTDINYQRYEFLYMRPVKNASTNFHARKDCSHLAKCNNIKDRSIAFARYHDAKPCEYCHD